jgi:hypothetical protein
VAAFPAFPACVLLPAAPARGPLLRTSAAAYEVEAVPYGFVGRIPFTFTNRTGGPVYLPNCKGDFAPNIQRRTAEGWEPVWLPIHNDCRSPIRVVPPGDTLRYTLVVTATPAQGDHPVLHAMGRLHAELSARGRGGPYRLVWGERQAYASYDERARPYGTSLPLEHRVSNAFTLRVREER